jgi:hypothetical protein
MASGIYNSFKKKILDTIDIDAQAIKIMLVTSSYTPDFDAHDFRDDITNEVSGTGYSAGGATLASVTVTQDNTDNEGVLDAADVTWASSTITARGAVLYCNMGSAATDHLIAYIDFGTDKTSSAGDFTIAWNAEGLINLT